MQPPLISYITHNIHGHAFSNLPALLKTRDKFELHITDISSADSNMSYLKNFKDHRIKSVTKLPPGSSPARAVNCSLLRRKPSQFFFKVDSDIHLTDTDWIAKFMQVFDQFSETGLLGLPGPGSGAEMAPALVPTHRNGVFYLKIPKNNIALLSQCHPRGIQAFRPEIFNYTQCWCWNDSRTDIETCIRINTYTPYVIGLVTNVGYLHYNDIPCSRCGRRAACPQSGDRDRCPLAGK